MKIQLNILSILIILLFNISCDKNDPVNIPSENYLGGDTNVTLGQVGNTFTGKFKIGNNYYDVNEDFRILSNVDGIVTANLKADLSQIPELSSLKNIAPPEFLNSDGNIDFDLKFKVTSDGIQDYNNDDKYAHTLVDYNSVVGSAYSIRHSDGTVHTRQVTAKSTNDDYYWGGWLIKTITVEQKAPIPGVEKYIIKANHRFGIVYFEMVMEDGSSVSSPIFPAYY
jgi:hypothetical protein